MHEFRAQLLTLFPFCNNKKRNEWSAAKRTNQQKNDNRNKKLIIDVFNMMENPSDEIIKHEHLDRLQELPNRKKNMRITLMHTHTHTHSWDWAPDWTHSILSDGELAIFTCCYWPMSSSHCSRNNNNNNRKTANTAIHSFRLSFGMYWKPQPM